MKTEGKVRRKFKQAKFRHLKKLLQANFKQNADNCKYNQLVRKDKRYLGVCSVQEDTVCDCLLPEVARSCDLFEPHRSKEEVTEEFEAFFERDIGEIAQEYPDLAALMWVLDLEEGDRSVLVQLEPDEPDEPDEPESVDTPEDVEEPDEPESVDTPEDVEEPDEPESVDTPEDVEEPDEPDVLLAIPETPRLTAGGLLSIFAGLWTHFWYWLTDKAA